MLISSKLYQYIKISAYKSSHKTKCSFNRSLGGSPFVSSPSCKPFIGPIATEMRYEFNLLQMK